MAVVQIQRGLPGSGKSYQALRTKEGVEAAGGMCVIASADDYFVVDGRYEFNFKKLGDAHDACFRKFLDALTRRVDRIIIDNTNVKLRHFENYLFVAQLAGYEIIVVEFLPPEDDHQLTTLSERNQHGVTFGDLKRMRSKWDSFSLDDWQREHPRR